VRNVIVITIDLDSAEKPLSTTKLVATFTLTASHKNTQDATLSDGKGGEVLMAPGTQYPFERTNLADLQVRSKAGETMYVVGHTAG
jgi:hypothetical protein